MMKQAMHHRANTPPLLIFMRPLIPLFHFCKGLQANFDYFSFFIQSPLFFILSDDWRSAVNMSLSIVFILGSDWRLTVPKYDSKWVNRIIMQLDQVQHNLVKPPAI